MGKCNCLQENVDLILKLDDISELKKSIKGKVISATFQQELINARTGKVTTAQGIEITYVHTTKGGVKKEKVYKTFFNHNYCPFCGQKY